MAKKDNEEIPFTAGPGSGASEKLKALQAAMDKICLLYTSDAADEL